MEFIIHLPDFHIVVCRECKYAILPSEIEAHFRSNRPHGFKKEVRDQIQVVVSRIEGLVTREELQNGTFEFPIDTAEPIAALATPQQNGLRCTMDVDGSECLYISKDKRRMGEHCKEKHGWKSSHQGGRPRKSDTVKEALKMPWREGVCYQQFFKQGLKSGFFEVGRAVERHNTRVQPAKTPWEMMQEQITQRFQEVKEISQRKIQATDESREPNLWLRRVRWPQHLEQSKLDQVELRDLIRSPDEEEFELTAIHEAFIRLIHAGQRIAVSNVVGLATLFEGDRKEVNQRVKRPFNSRLDKTTFRNYTHVWKQLLSYIWRVHNIPADERPPFYMTSKQESALQCIREAAEVVSQMPVGCRSSESRQAGEQLQSAILELCIKLLDHQLKDQEYESVLISGLAVLGLKEGGEWATAIDYTPTLAAVIKLARLMVLQQAFHTRQQTVRRKMDRGVSEEDAKQEAPSHVQLVRAMNEKFMRLMDGQNSPSPMDWILKTLTYGLYIRYHTAAEGSISWRGETVLYQKIQFSMTQLRGMILGLVADARRILIQDLLLLEMDDHGDIHREQLPPIDWANTVDNPTEQQLGWSFLQDPRNQFETRVCGRKWLVQRILEEPILRRKFIQSVGPTGITWRRTKINKYGQLIEKFKEWLWDCTHLSYGGPARTSEIINIRHYNTSNGGVRNIFISNGLVEIATGYHKGYEQSEKIKLIQRFLPREVGELLVYYLWLVLPFWEMIQVVVDGANEVSAFIWGDDQSHSKEETEEEKEEERVDDVVEVVDELARSHQSSRRPMKSWTPERMRKIMQRESYTRMGVKVGVSPWRQLFPAIIRKFMSAELQFGINEGSIADVDDVEEGNEDEDNVWDLQLGHSTKTAEMIYGRLLFENKFETQSQKEKYREASQEWHRFIGFPSSQTIVGFGFSRKRKRSHWEDVYCEMQKVRQKQLQHVNIQTRLETLIKVGSQFRGQQRPAIQAIMQGHSPILVIMGTGGGKSMTFMLPAGSISGGVTIVIVPLVALQGDLQERCMQAQISSVIWNSRRPFESASIVFVTPESAVSKTFAGAVNRWQEMHQLDRIVIDECHTTMDGSPSFRPKLKQLGELALLGTQMVYLTATLPPRDEAEFFQLLHIDCRHVQVFRGRTNRRNVAYRVQEVEVPERNHVFGWKADRAGFDEVIHAAVIQLVQQKLQEYPHPAKIIIYSSVVTGAEGLADVLGCEVYHRDIDCRDGKARRLEDWRNARDDGSPGQGRVIVATNALGLGVDVPDIRVVIHVGKIWKLKDYAQESGRAGRDGKQSEAIIVRGTGAGGDDYSVTTPGVVDIVEFIEGRCCRRVVLDQVMDAPKVRVGCEEGEEVCDVCQRVVDIDEGQEEVQEVEEVEEVQEVQEEVHVERVEEMDEEQRSPQRIQTAFKDSGFASSQTIITMPSSPPVIQQIRQRQWCREQVIYQRCREGRAIQELEEYLTEWSGDCPLCRWRGGPNPWHPIEQCSRADAVEVIELMNSMVRGIQYERYSCCYQCGVPQAICNRWKQVEEEAGRWKEDCSVECQYAGVLIAAVATILIEGIPGAEEEIFQWMQAEGVDINQARDVHIWFGRRVEWGGIEASKLVQVFHHLAQQHHI